MYRIKFVFMTLVIISQAKQLPESIRKFRCNAQSKDLNKCVIEYGNKVIPFVAEGFPEYHIPNMNPMELPFVQLINSPQMSMNLSNIRIHGLGTLKISDSNMVVKEGIFMTILRAGNITIEGQYRVNGKIMVMSVQGNGHFSIYLKNGIYRPDIRCTIYDRNGDKFLKRGKISLGYHFEKIIFNFENLFDGNAQLGQQLNEFLNENWDLILLEFGPGIVDLINSILGNIFDSFADLIPIKELFLFE